MSKLAEILMDRADAQKKLGSLRERIVANAVVQQGDQPHESSDKLLSEAFAVLDELQKLIVKVNRVNMSTKLADGRTLAEAIAERDMLAKKHGLLQTTIEGARREPERYSLNEIKWVTTVSIADLQQQADDLAKDIRELNAKIQEANWLLEVE